MRLLVSARSLGTGVLASGRGLALVAALATALSPACSLGAGSGTCTGTLDVPDCWSGTFDLHPDFFAAVPNAATNGMQLRIQRGGDYATFSDGVTIFVDDVGQVRGDMSSSGAPRPSLLGVPLVVGLPAGVTTPGVPISPNALPSIIHAVLYLDSTCRTQNDALYAVDAVTTNPDGSCSEPAGGDPPLSCQSSASAGAAAPGTDAGADGTGGDAGPDAAGGGAGPDAGVASPPAPVRTSTITFSALFDGNPDESSASERLSEASFHFFLADPREICPGGLGPPPRCRGELLGSFRFYFERGRPAQPFP